MYPRVKHFKNCHIARHNIFCFIRLTEYNALLYNETLQNPKHVTAIHTYIYPRVKHFKDYGIIFFFGFIRLTEYHLLFYNEILQNSQHVRAIHTYIHPRVKHFKDSNIIFFFWFYSVNRIQFILICIMKYYKILNML